MPGTIQGNEKINLNIGKQENSNFYFVDINGNAGYYNIGKPINSNVVGKNEISGTSNTYIGIINGNLDTSNFTSKILPGSLPFIIKGELLPNGLSGNADLGIDIKLKYNNDNKTLIINDDATINLQSE